MIRTAIHMLVNTRAKYLALVFGIAITAFLVTFAASFFCGMMTRSFALIDESPSADIWIMDPAVECVDQPIALPSNALLRVRSVRGVASDVPLLLAYADVRFANGRFQPVQIIGIDDATLTGLPTLADGDAPGVLRTPDAAAAADGGTIGKLETPAQTQDRWNYSRPHLEAPTRPLEHGDDIVVNDSRVMVVARAAALPRFPPRPLLYMTCSNALRILPIERSRTSYILASALPGQDPRELASRITAQTGLRARTAADFRADTVWWYLQNSEDVGDVEAMLTVALLVGLGMTSIMLFLFTQDNLRYYAMLRALGASPTLLLQMLLAQAGACAGIGTGIGLGLAAIAGRFTDLMGVPFRMMWFAPLAGGLAVILVSLLAVLLSARPLLKLEPAMVFASR